MRNPKASYVLRIVAGLYLVYLAWQLFHGSILTGELTGNVKIATYIATPAFLIVGLLFAGKGLIGMRQADKEPEYEETPSEEAEAIEAGTEEEETGVEAAAAEEPAEDEIPAVTEQQE